MQQLHAEPLYCILQRKHQNSGNQGNAKRTIERIGDFGTVVGAVCLCRKASCASPHETENGVHHAEDGAAQTDGSNVGDTVLMTHQHHVDQSQQWHGDVADDVGDG